MLNLIDKKQNKIKIEKKNSPRQIVKHLAGGGCDNVALELLPKLRVG
jgi:hypothetical protein